MLKKAHLRRYGGLQAPPRIWTFLSILRQSATVPGEPLARHRGIVVYRFRGIDAGGAAA
jgi:hypothetical protein